METQQTVAASPELSAYFPYIVQANEFFQVLLWDPIHPFDQAQNPGNLLGVLVWQ